MIDVTTCDHHGHWDVEDIKRLCEYRDQLRGNLSLAEEGLANYAQENTQLRETLLRLLVASQKISEEAALALARKSSGHPQRKR